MRAMGALTSTAAENQALWNLRSRRLCSVRKKAAVELPRLQTYEKLLAEKREEVGGLCQRLSVGLDKLISTGQDVAVMQEELVALQPVLEKTQKEVADMMVVIKADTEAANETKAVVAADEEAAPEA